MLSTVDMLDYMLARRVDKTYFIRADFDDPVLLQAELDGYAIREDGKWRGLGNIQPGERRTVRHIFGGETKVVG